MTSNSDIELWNKLCLAEAAFLTARMDFARNVRDPSAVVGTALRSVRQRGTALRVLQGMPEVASRPHLAALVEEASVGHSDILAVRQVIQRIDRSWLTTNIDAHAIDVLKTGGEEEYRRIAELYELLDKNLLALHIARCAAHSDSEVREIADDYAARGDLLR